MMKREGSRVMIDTIIRRCARNRTHVYPLGAATPLFTADWRDTLLMHFEMDPAILQPAIPFELDTREGRAFISLVAFTQANLRPRRGGRIPAWLTTPLATHEFLNLRTYVRVNQQPAIYFIAEWIPNRLATLVGPRMYGLPYRLGRLRYRHDGRRRALSGRVTARGGTLQYRAGYTDQFRAARHNTLDYFLLERYAAFTCRNGVCRRFDVDHSPWPQQRVELTLEDRSILRLAGDWHERARFVVANFSPGVERVSISVPRQVPRGE